MPHFPEIFSVVLWCVGDGTRAFGSAVLCAGNREQTLIRVFDQFAGVVSGGRPLTRILGAMIDRRINGDRDSVHSGRTNCELFCRRLLRCFPSPESAQLIGAPMFLDAGDRIE